MVEEWCDEEESGGGVEEEPAEVRDAGSGFFEHAGVALNEEDVEEEVERERAEVDEGREEAPVLPRRISLALLIGAVVNIPVACETRRGMNRRAGRASRSDTARARR